MKNSRRQFLWQTGTMAAGMGLLGFYGCDTVKNTVDKGVSKSKDLYNDITSNLFFKISLAQWSLHKALFSGQLDNLGFAAKAKNDFGIDAVEYVNAFFKDKANNLDYLREMNKRANDNGVKNLLIMIDAEGGLGDLDDSQRLNAVENHYKWVNAAKYLGCHSIRVNAYGEGSAADVAKAAIDGLGRLTEYAEKEDINIIVENHGGHSSNGAWLAGVIKSVNKKHCGTLPDFGNFCIRRESGNCKEEYDRYTGVQEMMPHAKGVSAKTHDFDAAGNETHTDYDKMLRIVKDAGYRGYIGIEYEGGALSEEEGIKATKALLVKAGKAMS